MGFVDKESQLGKKYANNRSKSKFYKDAVFFSSAEILDYLRNVGFHVSKTRQTLIPEEPPGTVEDGLGKGAFVVIKAVKEA